MRFLLLLLVCFILWISVIARLILLNPHWVSYFGVTDLYHYFRYHLYDIAPTGKIKCYCAHFGGGKTLSAVHEIVSFYRRYNNKKIFDPNKNKWLTQKVLVISNVEFTCIPFEPLVGLHQLVELQQYNLLIDEKNDTLTCCIFFIDEASSQLNSRSFVKNFSSTNVLGALVTCRHYRTSLIYTSQKFNQVDKLLREDTQEVIQCRKVWRFVVHSHYNADVLEYAPDPTIIKPIFRNGFFVKMEYYWYDTLALVSNLSHSAESGDMLSAEEILAKRSPLLSDVDDKYKKKRFRRH